MCSLHVVWIFHVSQKERAHELFDKGQLHFSSMRKNHGAIFLLNKPTRKWPLSTMPDSSHTIGICTPPTLLMDRKHALIHFTNRITQFINILCEVAGKYDCLALCLE